MKDDVWGNYYPLTLQHGADITEISWLVTTGEPQEYRAIITNLLEVIFHIAQLFIRFIKFFSRES